VRRRIEQIGDRAHELWGRAKELWPAPVQSSEPVLDSGFIPETLIERLDNKLRDAKREAIMEALSHRESAILSKVRGILYASANGKVRAACPVSRRYTRTSSSYYWYGYSKEWLNFLSQGEKSFLVLGCMDRESAYAIPNKTIEKVLNELYETPGRHWHIILEENEKGLLELSIPDGRYMALIDFELKLTPSAAEATVG
jgi:hypothetical protein